MKKTYAWFLVLVILTISCTVTLPSANADDGVSGNSWATMKPMPTARSGLGVAAANGRLYAIGGATKSEYSKANEMYNPSTNTWTTKQSMPTARYHFAIAVYENKIYCIGGDGPVTANEVYDPATNTWATLKSMPTPRTFLQANVVDGKIYLIGGERGGATDLNEVYDIATDTWTNKRPIPKAVLNYASAVVDDKIYILGGFGPIARYDSVQIYDPATDSWGNGTPPPSTIKSPCAAATTGVYAHERIYILGGVDLYSYSDNVVYDPQTDSWSTANSMPTARGYLGVAVVDDILYAIGGTGWNYAEPPVSTNEKYTPFMYGTIPPTVTVASPENNRTYTSDNVSLAYAVNKPADNVSYSLDGQEPVPLTGNTTLNLTVGSHTVRIYATDKFGNTGTSQHVTFTVTQPSTITPATTIIQATAFTPEVEVAAVATVIIFFVGLLVYLKKRKH